MSAAGGGGAAEYRRQLRAILFNLRDRDTDSSGPNTAVAGGVAGDGVAAGDGPTGVDGGGNAVDPAAGAGVGSAEVSDWALSPSALLMTSSQLALNQYPMTPEMHATIDQTMKTGQLYRSIYREIKIV